MAKLIDLTGNTFGRWTVIERVPNQHNRPHWLCRCECGTERVVVGQHLNDGTSQSCGCLRREMSRLPEGQAAFNVMYAQYKRNAKDRGIPFELTKEDFSFITKMDCHYCGVEPKQITSGLRLNGDYLHNGIDRIDNTKGYTMDNVVPCCGLCNEWKRTRTVAEFIDHAKMIVNHRG